MTHYTTFIATFSHGAVARHGRRTLLAVLAARTLGAGWATPHTSAKKKKSCNKIRKKALAEADLRCQLQRPTCEVTLSAVCGPGPDLQECLDATAECCNFLAECDAQGAMECVIRAFLTAPPP